MAGLKRLISRQFDIESTIAETKAKVVKEGRARRVSMPQPGPYPHPTPNKERGRKEVSLPARISNVSDLDDLIRTLEALRRELAENDLDLVLKGELEDGVR
jgi:hypothetical protein